MLEVAHLYCARGERLLFSDISFSLQAGEWLHVQGGNGAGKTSLLRQLVGLSPCAHGSVRWRGQSVPGTEARADTIYLGHQVAVKEDLSPWENLRLSATLDGQKPSDADALRALHRLGLRGREDLPVRVLSAGQKRRVSLARLLLRPAPLWVLDEAFNALDIGAVGLLGELIAEHLTQGGMAVLTSHQALPLPPSKVLTL